mgnify:CR=1 FL=1
MVLRDKFFEKKVPEEERAAVNVIFSSKPVANQGITLSSRVSAEQAEKIKAELSAVSVATAPTLKRFAGKPEKMIKPNNTKNSSTGRQQQRFPGGFFYYLAVVSV